MSHDSIAPNSLFDLAVNFPVGHPKNLIGDVGAMPWHSRINPGIIPACAIAGARAGWQHSDEFKLLEATRHSISSTGVGTAAWICALSQPFIWLGKLALSKDERTGFGLPGFGPANEHDPDDLSDHHK